VWPSWEEWLVPIKENNKQCIKDYIIQLLSRTSTE
jgi:hypothetical protein